MSFILDALKKSESDRQRQSGPALFEVRVAPPRNSLPLWAIGLAGLLAVNLVIVAWVLLRRPAAPEQPTAASTSAPTANAPIPPQPIGPTQWPQSANNSPGGYAGPQQGFGPPAPATTAVPVAGVPPTAPVGQPAGMTQQAPPAPTMGATATNAVTTVNDAGTDTSGEKLNPDDYAPATDPAPAPFGNHVTRTTATGVPLYQDAQQTARLPNLHLDLHVFAANPQQRFVMINTRKLHEGDSLPEGVRVESITPDGAVLSLNGTRFLLPRE